MEPKGELHLEVPGSRSYLPKACQSFIRATAKVLGKQTTCSFDKDSSRGHDRIPTWSPTSVLVIELLS